MAGKRKPKDDDDIDMEMLHAMQQYTDDEDFIAEMFATTRDMLPPRQYKPNATKCIDFALWYTAHVKKDIRAIIYWLDAHAKTTYGKNAGMDQDESLRTDILALLAERLPD